MTPTSLSGQAPPPCGEIPFSQELWRKATHMGALVIPGGYYALGLDRGQALLIIAPISALMVVIDIARLRHWGLWEKFASKVFSSMVRPHEDQGDFTGATYILLAACLTIALFAQSIAVAALAFIIVGDSFAAVIGRRWGRHRLVGRKTYEGTLGCLVGTLIVAFLAPNLPISIGIVGAVIATLTEAFSFKIDDNLSVPLLSGLIMSLLQKVV